MRKRLLRIVAGIVLSVMATAAYATEVTGLILVNAATDTDVQTLNDGDTIDLAQVGSSLNVRANVAGTVGSVRFGYDGTSNYQTESVAPYALAGDTNGDYNSWTPTVGTHTIVATPYTEASAGGTAGTAKTVTFTVVDDGGTPPPPPPPPPSGENDVVAYPHSAAGTVSGELKKWHKVTLGFDGPSTSETASKNPFTDYRLDVTFSNGGTSYTVPGYYAADGNAANSGAVSGNVWLVHFAPNKTGAWTWNASFTTGSNVAQNGGGSPAGYMNGKSGSFTIGATDKSGRDHRGKGRLQYVGEHYLRFAETGEYFLKQGADAPENFLAYADFDGPFKSDGNKDNLIKTWSAHAGDWASGDPTWKGGKGKAMIGAVNYLASEEMNAFSFLTMNINGDDQNVFPYLDYGERLRMDVSRLAQWEVVFEHADKLGMYLHFKTQETENDQLLDGGALGNQRKLYYRELIARFGHHLALNWNLGEENTNTDAQRKAFAQFFWDNDPYRHNIVLHTYPGQKDSVYTPMLGDASKLTGLSLQGSSSSFTDTPGMVKTWVEKSAQAGKKWVVAVDEPGDASHAIRSDYDAGTSHVDGRKNALWGTLMSGGAGDEYYFGYQHDHSDLTCQDFRSRDQWWDYCRYALQFFKGNDIPFHQMTNDNGKSSASDDYCFFKSGEVYVVYLKNGGTTSLDLSGVSGTFTVKWFDPRNGGSLKNGSVTSVSGGGSRSLGTAPDSTTSDWAILVQKDGSTPVNEAPSVNAGTNQTITLPDNDVNLNGTVSDDGLPDGSLTTSWSKVSGPGTVIFGNASNVDTTATLGTEGTYVLRLTASDGALSASDDVTITVEPEPVGQAPYGATPHAVPGVIQAEDCDIGGEGVAYHDTTSGNSGGTYRTENVDIQSTSDTGGGYNVGWIANGEWLEYTVDVQSAGTYDIAVRVASLSAGGNLHLSFDGVDKTGTLSFPATGGWQTWTTIEKKGVSLSAGEQVMRLSMDSSSFNVNWIEIAASAPVNTSPTATGDSYSVVENGTLYIAAADGVLVNDSDPENDSLTALLQDGTSFGSLTLYADGSFDYIPDLDYTGTDSFTYVASDGDLQSAPVTVNITVTPAASGGEVVFAVNCGGSGYTAADGAVYAADTGFSGGKTYTKGDAISGTDDDPLYQSERYGNFIYAVPLADGDYVVTVQFAEIYWTAAGQRVFDVSLEGQEVVSNLDLYAEVGHDAAYDQVVPVTVSDGELNIAFSTDVNNAKVSAIRVESAGGSSTPSALIDATFDNDPAGFVYADDTFRATARPAYADGVLDTAEGNAAPSLAVTVGGVDDADITDVSGGWSIDFTLDDPAEVTIGLDYRLLVYDGFEPDEYAEALVSVDGVLVGQDGNDSLSHIAAGGDSGWQGVILDLGSLESGTHTLTVGGYCNKKTVATEAATVWFDNIEVTAVP